MTRVANNDNESNSSLEIEDQSLFLKHGENILQKPDELKNATIIIENSTLVLSMVKNFGYPFRCKMKLTEGPKELFFQQVTQPLLRVVSDLKHSQHELFQLLERKDKYIEDYRTEKGEIPLKHNLTEKFNEAEHMMTHISYCEMFGDSQIPSDLMKEREKIILKEEKQDEQITVKEESTSESAVQNRDDVKTKESAEEIKQEMKHEPIVSRRKKPRLNF